MKTFDTETAHEGEEEDVEIIKNLKFYKKSRHYRQLQLPDGDAYESSDSEPGNSCSPAKSPVIKEVSGDSNGKKNAPEEQPKE